MRILIADDHTLVRQGFVALLAREPDLIVVGEAADGFEAVRLVAELSPDLAILDVGMPGLNGIVATARIRADSPQTRVLAISVHADGRYVRQIVEQADDTPVARLSPRELDVVRLVADGYRASEIAARLGVSIKTAEAHRRNAMRKLMVATVADLVRLALRERLVVGND